MNTPALLGLDRPVEQEYVMYADLDIRASYRWILGLLLIRRTGKYPDSYCQVSGIYGIIKYIKRKVRTI